jgi:hypothetical protein
MSKDLYPLDYYLSVFSRECIVNSSGKMEDGLSQELITAVYSVASDRADMSRMCRVLRKYGVNTLKKLKDTPQIEMMKWRNCGGKTIEKFAHMRSLPVVESKEQIIRRYDVNKLKHEIAILICHAYSAGIQKHDMEDIDYDEILLKAEPRNYI